MLDFQGDKQFPLDPATVFARLRDASFVARCIPDASVDGEPTREAAHLTVHPGFSFVRGTLDVDLRVAAVEEPSFIKFLAASKGVGATSEVEVALAVTGQDSGTHVDWRAEVKSLGGLLKMVPTGLIRGAAQKVIEDIWASIGQHLHG